MPEWVSVLTGPAWASAILGFIIWSLFKAVDKIIDKLGTRWLDIEEKKVTGIMEQFQSTNAWLRDHSAKDLEQHTETRSHVTDKVDGLEERLLANREIREAIIKTGRSFSPVGGTPKAVLPVIPRTDR